MFPRPLPSGGAWHDPVTSRSWRGPEAPRPLFRISRRPLLDLALHLNTRAGEAHHELERLAPGVADAVETLRRRHHAERTRADRTRLDADSNLALTLQTEEAL